MNESISFERIADSYDTTRGGLYRGRNFAAAVEPHLLPGARALEIGVGTGAIAQPLAEAGHAVVGVDISPAMLAQARDRLGARVAIADAARLPVPDACCDAIIAVWVLHLVGDQRAVLAECRRALRPGGRVVAVLNQADEEPTDVGDIVGELHAATGRRRTVPDDSGLTLVHRGATDVMEFEESATRTAAVIESRTWSWLWDFDDDEWATIVVPYVERIRNLPDPDRPRHRRQSHPLVVFEK